MLNISAAPKDNLHGFLIGLDGIQNFDDEKNKAFVIERIRLHNLPKVGIMITKRSPSPYAIIDGFEHNHRLKFKTKYIRGKRNCEFPESFRVPFRVPNIPLKFVVTLRHQFFKIVKGVNELDYELGQVTFDLSEFSNRLDSIHLEEYPFDGNRKKNMSKKRRKKVPSISLTIKFINFRKIADIISSPHGFSTSTMGDPKKAVFQPLKPVVEEKEESKNISMNDILEESEEEEEVKKNLKTSTKETDKEKNEQFFDYDESNYTKKYSFPKLQARCDRMGSLEVFIPMKYQEELRFIEDIFIGKNQRLHFYVQEHDIFTPKVKFRVGGADRRKNKDFLNILFSEKKVGSRYVIKKTLFVVEVKSTGTYEVSVSNEQEEDSGKTTFRVKVL